VRDNRFPVAPDPAIDFVRYDPATGAILSRGRMHPDLIAEEQKTGSTIRPADIPWDAITQDTHKVDISSGKIVSMERKVDPSVKTKELRAAIAKLLGDTDKYFIGDWQDNITAQEQAQWRTFRRALRNANKGADAAAIIAALPAATPDGIDPFAQWWGA
jgi:hypothetical protein